MSPPGSARDESNIAKHVVEGLENAPRALIGLLRGENFGKLLVRVTANDTRQQH